MESCTCTFRGDNPDPFPETILGINNCSLEFLNVTLAHHGTYDCVVSNSYEELKATFTFNLIVQGKAYI